MWISIHFSNFGVGFCELCKGKLLLFIGVNAGVTYIGDPRTFPPRFLCSRHYLVLLFIVYSPAYFVLPKCCTSHFSKWITFVILFPHWQVQWHLPLTRSKILPVWYHLLLIQVDVINIKIWDTKNTAYWLTASKQIRRKQFWRYPCYVDLQAAKKCFVARCLITQLYY